MIFFQQLQSLKLFSIYFLVFPSVLLFSQFLRYLELEIIDQIILNISMGNNESQQPLLCNNFTVGQKISKQQKKKLQHNRNSTSSTSEQQIRINLEQFKGKLTIQQCFYVLMQLLQLSFLVLVQKGKVAICTNFFQVNSWGQIQANFKEIDIVNRNDRPIICTSLANIITGIMQILKELSFEQSWQEILEKSRFFEKMMKIIYRHHQKPQVQLFKQLMEDILLFKESNNFKSNLLSAILRLKSDYNQQSIFLGYSHTDKSKQQPTLDRFLYKKAMLNINPDNYSKKDYSKMENSTKLESTFIGMSKNRKRTCRNFSKTEGEDYFNLNMELYRSCIREQAVTKRQKQIKDQKSKNHISFQYSINILNTKPKEEVQSRRKVRFRDSKENIFEKKEKEVKLHRNNTTENFNGKQKRGKHERSNAKSVLQQLARSVEVLDHPSSKSLIF